VRQWVEIMCKREVLGKDAGGWAHAFPPIRPQPPHGRRPARGDRGRRMEGARKLFLAGGGTGRGSCFPTHSPEKRRHPTQRAPRYAGTRWGAGAFLTEEAGQERRGPVTGSSEPQSGACRSGSRNPRVLPPLRFRSCGRESSANWPTRLSRSAPKAKSDFRHHKWQAGT
jgi:hypothetical protein